MWLAKKCFWKKGMTSYSLNQFCKVSPVTHLTVVLPGSKDLQKKPREDLIGHQGSFKKGCFFFFFCTYRSVFVFVWTSPSFCDFFKAPKPLSFIHFIADKNMSTCNRINGLFKLLLNQWFSFSCYSAASGCNNRMDHN